MLNDKPKSSQHCFMHFHMHCTDVTGNLMVNDILMRVLIVLFFGIVYSLLQ